MEVFQKKKEPLKSVVILAGWQRCSSAACSQERYAAPLDAKDVVHSHNGLM